MIHELHFFFNNGSSIVDIPIENIFHKTMNVLTTIILHHK